MVNRFIDISSRLNRFEPIKFLINKPFFVQLPVSS